MPQTTIFYFEDDSDSLGDFYAALEQTGDVKVEIGAHRDLIERSRERPLDLLIVDFMIHHHSFDIQTGEEVENIFFEGVEWRRTGLEFLQRVRAGRYTHFGFPSYIPAIVATAVVNYPARKLAIEQGISGFLVKPFTIDELRIAVQQALDSAEK